MVTIEYDIIYKIVKPIWFESKLIGWDFQA